MLTNAVSSWGLDISSGLTKLVDFTTAPAPTPVAALAGPFDVEFGVSEVEEGDAAFDGVAFGVLVTLRGSALDGLDIVVVSGGRVCNSILQKTYSVGLDSSIFEQLLILSRLLCCRGRHVE